jgi:hypothetical protein
MATKRKSDFRGKVTNDAKRQQKAATSYGYLNLPKGVNVFSPEPGSRVQFDILPYVITDPKHPDRNPDLDIAMPGTLWYKRPFRIHRNIGIENDSVVCLASIGKRCPICEHRAKLTKEGAEKEEIDALKSSLRNIYIVVPIGHKKFEETPYVFDISQFLFQNLLNEELEEDEDNAVFPDLEEGKTLKVRFESRTIGSGQPFSEASRIDFVERDATYPESILDEVPNLDEILKILSYDELHAKFFEIDTEEDGGKLKSATDDDDEEEEPEVEEKPKPRKSLRKPKEEIEEEEEPVVEEKDEEEEPKHKPTRGSYSAGPGTKNGELVKPSRRRNGAATEERCPFGHRFGIDTEQFDDCDKCKIFDECDEANTTK